MESTERDTPNNTFPSPESRAINHNLLSSPSQHTPIDNENYAQIIRSLNSIFADIETQHGYQAEDLRFFEKAVEALLTNYWDKFDPYKGKIFRNRLQNRFRKTDKNDTSARIKYYKASLEEVIAHLGKRQEHAREQRAPGLPGLVLGKNQVNSALAAATTDSFPYSPVDVNFLGFGSGDLVYSRPSKASDTASKRLKIEGTSSFPRIGTDIFTNDLQPNDSADRKVSSPSSPSSSSGFLNYPNFNPKVRRFNQDLSKNNFVSSALGGSNAGASSSLRSDINSFDFSSTSSLLTSMNGLGEHSVAGQGTGPKASSSGQTAACPSDVYEFVSALNNLKHRNPDVSTGLSSGLKDTHRTPGYINSLRESFDFLHAQPDSSGSHNVHPGGGGGGGGAAAAAGGSGAIGDIGANGSLHSSGSTVYSPQYQGHQPQISSSGSGSSANSVHDDSAEEKVFKCDNCSLSFKRNSDLKRHVKIHLTLLPHICNNCGKSFARKDALKRHYGTLTCNRNKENMTYIANLKYLTEEERNRDLSATTRRKKKS